MSRLKKAIALVLAATMVLTFAACAAPSPLLAVGAGVTAEGDAPDGLNDMISGVRELGAGGEEGESEDPPDLNSAPEAESTPETGSSKPSDEGSSTDEPASSGPNNGSLEGAEEGKKPTDGAESAEDEAVPGSGEPQENTETKPDGDMEDPDESPDVVEGFDNGTMDGEVPSEENPEGILDSGVPGPIKAPARAATEIKKYEFDFSYSIIDNRKNPDGDINPACFLLTGDESKAAGKDKNYYYISQDDDSYPIYGRAGETYDIEIVNDPYDHDLKNYGYTRDERIMKVTVSIDSSGRVTTSNLRFEMPDGSISGDQTKFIITILGKYWINVPKTVIGNHDPKANDGRFLIKGDECEAAGQSNHSEGHWFATDHVGGMALIYGRKGETYEIEIVNDPFDEYEKRFGLVHDERTMKVTVHIDENGEVTTSNLRFELPDGSTPGNQSTFIIKVIPDSVWTDEEIQRANDIMFDMTLEEKVGQMFLVHYPGDGSGSIAQAKAIIDKWHPGGFLVFAAMFNGSTPDIVRNKTNAAQSDAKIPMLFSVDEEGGKVTRISQYPAFRASKFPAPQDLAAQGNDAVEADAAEKANLLKGLGLWVNHAPVADVSGSSGYIYARTYGGDGVYNAGFVASAVKGHEENGIATTLKHFPGYGGTSSNTHNGFAVNNLSLADFQYNDLLPFYAGIGAGSNAVMVTHNIVNAFDSDMPASLSAPVISYLRDEMNFDGVVMTDDLNMKAILDTVGDGHASLACIKAGVDMPMTPQPEKDIPVVLAAIQSGELSMERINESCRRVLCWKIRQGLIDLEVIDPPVEEQEARWSNGTVTRVGKFADMWSVASKHGGVIEFLTDVDSEALTVAGNIMLNLNGHKLNVSGTFGITVPAGTTLDVVDLADMTVSASGKVSGTHRNPELSNSADAVETPAYNAVRRTLVWNEVDPDSGATTQHEANFDALGTIVGKNGSAGISITGGTVNLKSGVLTHPTQGVSMKSGSLNISGGAVLGCGYETKPANGGAVSIEGGSMVMTAGYLGGNQASTRGGAVYVTGEGSSVTINGPDAVIACNTSGVQAGGFYVYTSATLDFKQGRIASNKSGSNGGAIYCYGCTVEIGKDSENPPIITDSESTNGGGIFLYNNATKVNIYAGAITGNKAKLGGGIAVGAGASGGSLTIYHTTEQTRPVIISYNNATANGGGICYNSANRSTIRDALIRNNSADNYGGGVWLGGTVVELNSVKVTQNTAGVDGGGLWWVNDSELYLNGTPVVSDNTLTDGQADNVMVPTGKQFTLGNETLVVGTVICFEPEVYPEGTQAIPVVTGPRVAVQNSRHAFRLEDGEKASQGYSIILHAAKGELDVVVKSNAGLAVDVNDVLFQWYAPVRQLAISGDNSRSLKVIDTSAGADGDRLPKNGNAVPGKEPTLRYIFLNEDGTVQYDEELLPLYESEDMALADINSIDGMWRFGGTNKAHSRYQIWVATNGSTGLSVNPDDWIVYDWHDNLRFTTEADQAGPNTIYLARGYVVRFVGGVKTEPAETSATFFDYDISDGQVYGSVADAKEQTKPLSAEQIVARRANRSKMYLNTNGNGKGQGINNIVNYPAGTNATNAFGFGNANAGMPWSEAIHGDTVVVSGKKQPSVLNRFNRASFEGCNFGIVTGLDEDGVPVADNGVNMPKLFGDGPDAEVRGKTTYNDLGLKFLRYGNTFTLGEVIGTDVTNLDSFGHPGIYDGIQNKTCIWTNNFWPMDGKVQDGDGHDPVFGNNNHTVYYESSTGQLPKSDDGLDHNSYFGMQCEIGFDLPASYIGPLDYTFFGDDDMWVFLDGKQIVDIGGVHRSVGMYVNLWDYLSREDAGSHKLSFFFTERGASGSTCWMNFCLPNIKTTSGPDVTPTGSLRIEKQVTGEGAETDKDFEFEVTLDLTNEEGTVLDRIYNYYGSRIGSIRSGETLRLKADEYVVIEDIPAGTEYRVRELEATGYIPTYSDTSEGTMGEELVTVSVLNERISGPLLPETGGPGVTVFHWAGLQLVLAAAFLFMKRRELETA